MKKSFKQLYEDLKHVHEDFVKDVHEYHDKYYLTRSVDSCNMPAYGQPGQEADKAKTSPNVFFVKDLITQVMSAKTLGFETVLHADGSILTVTFREPKPSLPLKMRRW